MAKNRKIAIWAAGIAGAALLICLVVGLWYFFRATADDGRIFQNVYAAGINLGGMTPEEAAVALHTMTDDTYTKQDMRITSDQGDLVLTPADTGARLDVEALVELAFNYGRTGSRAEQNQARAASAASGYTIELLSFLNLDTDYIHSAIETFAEQHSSVLTAPSATISGERPVLQPIPEDPEAVPQTLTVQAGIPGCSIDTEQLYNAVLDAYNQNDFSGVSAQFTVVPAEPLDTATLFKDNCVPTVDAVLNEEDYSVTEEIWGYGFDLPAVNNFLSTAKPGERKEFPLKFLKPAVTADMLKEDLFCDELATYDSPYNQYNYNRSTNLELAAAAINGTILRPGETFSFNGIVGERTSEKGYKGAPAYVGGDTVDQLGGGVCQVASTIYYCTLMADLEIVDREEHMYAASYVPMGMDATINWGTIDFKFRNNTSHPIRIDTWAEDGEVHVSLMGTEEKDYYVEMEYEVERVYDWETVKKEMAPDNPKGYEDGEVIQDPYTGYDVKTYKCKYDRETDELISRTYEATSNYEKRDKLVCVINKPTEPPTEPPTDPPETDPPETDPPETDPPETDPPEPDPTEVDPTEPEPEAGDE